MTTEETLSDNTEETIAKESTYVIRWIMYESGKTSLQRTCEGFNPFELLGLLSLTEKEIIDQIKGKIKPTIIERNYVEPKPPTP